MCVFYILWKVITALIGDSESQIIHHGDFRGRNKTFFFFFPRRNLSLQIVRRPASSETICRFRHSCPCFCPESFTHRDCAARPSSLHGCTMSDCFLIVLIRITGNYSDVITSTSQENRYLLASKASGSIKCFMTIINLYLNIL